MCKHLGYYHGPATVTRQIRTRQFAIQHGKKEFKWDIEMLVPVVHLPELFREFDPVRTNSEIPKPSLHDKSLPITEGEMLIILEPDKKDWYLAEVSQKYEHSVVLNYYTTPAQPLSNYSEATQGDKLEHLKQMHFRKTWFIHGGNNAGKGTIKPPFPNNPDLRIWNETIPMEEVTRTLLIRNAAIDAVGLLTKETLALASKLPHPHNALQTVDDPFYQKDTGEKDQGDNALFNYAQHDLCKCKGCAKRLSKSVKIDNLDCGCFLCEATSLAS